MLDFKTQSQLVDATAAMMRTCVAATTNAWAASACHGLSLWAEMLGAGTLHRATSRQGRETAYPSELMLWPSPANWTAAPWTAWPWLPGDAARGAWTRFAGTWSGPSFSLWMPLADERAGAVGQPLPPAVTVPTTRCQSLDKPRADALAGFASYRSAGGHAMAQTATPATELAQLTALSPMHTVLGMWRAALGV